MKYSMEQHARWKMENKKNGITELSAGGRMLWKIDHQIIATENENIFNIEVKKRKEWKVSNKTITATE